VPPLIFVNELFPTKNGRTKMDAVIACLFDNDTLFIKMQVNVN
jgi:hypothetical protein